MATIKVPGSWWNYGGDPVAWPFIEDDSWGVRLRVEPFRQALADAGLTGAPVSISLRMAVTIPQDDADSMGSDDYRFSVTVGESWASDPVRYDGYLTGATTHIDVEFASVDLAQFTSDFLEFYFDNWGDDGVRIEIGEPELTVSDGAEPTPEPPADRDPINLLSDPGLWTGGEAWDGSAYTWELNGYHGGLELTGPIRDGDTLDGTVGGFGEDDYGNLLDCLFLEDGNVLERVEIPVNSDPVPFSFPVKYGSTYEIRAVVGDSWGPMEIYGGQLVIALQAAELAAVDDTDTTRAGTPVTTNVLSNDTYGDKPVSLDQLKGAPVITRQPANGTAVVNADGTITYTPEGNFAGEDTYVYAIQALGADNWGDVTDTGVSLEFTPPPHENGVTVSKGVVTGHRIGDWGDSSWSLVLSEATSIRIRIEDYDGFGMGAMFIFTHEDGSESTVENTGNYNTWVPDIVVPEAPVKKITYIPSEQSNYSYEGYNFYIETAVPETATVTITVTENSVCPWWLCCTPNPVVPNCPERPVGFIPLSEYDADFSFPVASSRLPMKSPRLADCIACGPASAMTEPEPDPEPTPEPEPTGWVQFVARCDLATLHTDRWFASETDIIDWLYTDPPAWWDPNQGFTIESDGWTGTYEWDPTYSEYSLVSSDGVQELCCDPLKVPHVLRQGTNSVYFDVQWSCG